jgi:hypothetical protein
MLLDVYPAAAGSGTCQLSMDGFGYPHVDFVDYIRFLARHKPVSTPLWLILQTHRYDSGDLHALRQPTIEEVRQQNWLALGEGATGVFWFVYSSQQGWTGLRDNPELFHEVAVFAHRLRPLRGTLLGLNRVSDRFQVSSRGRAYVSTLSTADGSALYAIAVNRDCDQAQELAIQAPTLRGALVDMESGQRYELGQSIPTNPGDGRILRFEPA